MDIKTFEDADARNMSNKDHKELQIYGIATLMEFETKMKRLDDLVRVVAFVSVIQTILLLVVLAQ